MKKNKQDKENEQLTIIMIGVVIGLILAAVIIPGVFNTLL